MSAVDITLPRPTLRAIVKDKLAFLLVPLSPSRRILVAGVIQGGKVSRPGFAHLPVVREHSVDEIERSDSVWRQGRMTNRQENPHQVELFLSPRRASLEHAANP